MSDMRQSGEYPHLEPVIKEYESALRITLHLHHPFRGFSKSREGPGFHLHLNAIPRTFPLLSLMGQPPTIALPIAFDHPLHGGAGRALSVAGLTWKGVPLRDDAGNTLAYLHQRNIFILFDVAAQTEELAPLLLRHLLDRALELMKPDLVAQSGLHPDRLRLILAGLQRTTHAQEAAWRTTRRGVTQRQFQEGRLEQIGDEIGFLESEILSAEKALDVASLRLTAEARHLQACRRRLQHLRGEFDRDEADVARELARIWEQPDVANAAASPPGLQITTRPIQGQHGGKVYSLGSFRIDLCYNGKITIHNLTSSYGYYDHPHIWNGNPCLGNIRPGVAKLIGEYQLAAACEVLLDFLKTINHRDWHISIEHWREVPPANPPASLCPGKIEPVK